MISELNNPWYAPPIKILIISRKRPAESRDGIIHRARTHMYIHTYIYTSTADTPSVPVVFSFIGYTRGDSAAKINSRSSVCPAETIFSLPTWLWKGWRKMPTPLSLHRYLPFSFWKFNEPSKGFYERTLSVLCCVLWGGPREKLSVHTRASRLTRELFDHEYLSVNLESDLRDRWLNVYWRENKWINKCRVGGWKKTTEWKCLLFLNFCCYLIDCN